MTTPEDRSAQAVLFRSQAISHIGRTDPIDLPVRVSAPHRRLIVAVLLIVAALVAAWLLLFSVDGHSPARILLTVPPPGAASTAEPA